jgi:tight adherence protein C
MDDFILLTTACTALGGAVFVLVWTVAKTLRTEDLAQDTAWRYDVTRINELRRISALYRYFQPVIQLLARFNRGAFRDSIPELDREVQAAGLPRVWTGAEYLARLELIALLVSPLYFFACIRMMGIPGSVMAGVFTVLTAYVLRRRLAARANYRLVLIKRRLPFLLDLLTLLMEAGSTFLQALREGVTEFRDHPVGAEFGRVLAELNMGKTRIETFESMRHRLADDEITSIVGSIIQGEQLGTPLARLFRTQADVLRIKRTQRAETLAGEAGVKMLMPAILVMAATVIIILGPFLLSFFYADFMS